MRWDVFAIYKLTFTEDKEKDVYGRQRKAVIADKKKTFVADTKRDVYGRHEKGRLRQTRKGGLQQT